MKFTTHTPWYLNMIIMSSIVVGSCGSIFAGLDLSLPVSPGLITKSFPVKFGGGGNEFAGVFVIDNIASIAGKTIEFGTSSATSKLICKKQIKGYYFNAARGAWLLPLASSQPGQMSGLYMTGGLYTSCEGGALTDIVGALRYSTNPITTSTDANLGTLVFGTNLTSINIQNNAYGNGTYKTGSISWNSVGLALQVNGNFFDSMLGIGQISSSNVDAAAVAAVTAASGTPDVADLIGAFNKIYVQGHIGVGQSVDSNEREVLTISLAGTKTLLTSSDEVIASTVINTVEKNRAKQCRKGENQSGGQKGKFVCVDNSGGTVAINSGNINEYANKDVVFTDANVFIDESVYLWYKNNSNSYLSIYVANGNLIFDSDIDDPNLLTDVDKNGFKTTTNANAKSKGLYLVGNFIVNGIVLGAKDETAIMANTYTSIPFKTFVHGKFTSLNTFTTVSDKRVTLLTNLMDGRTLSYSDFVNNSSLGLSFNEGVWNPSMESLFTWRCATTTQSGSQSQTGGMGAYPVGPSFTQTTIDAVKSIACPSAAEEYPLVIIEKNLSTLFFLK